MKKKLGILVSLLVMAIGLSGCGGKKNVTSGSTVSDTLSKSEWIRLLGDGFGYNTPFSEDAIYSDIGVSNECYAQIQACAEWGVITEQNRFEPNEIATWEYALKTSVRAIGIDNINSAGGQVSEENLIDFFGSNIANIGEIDLNSSITLADAEQLIGYALDYSYRLSPMERFEYTYNEGVYEVTAEDILLCGDGQSAWITNGVTYQNGDIIYIQPSETSIATAIRVVSYDADKMTYEEAAVEDVYSELQVAGTYEATIISVDSPDEQMNVSYQNNTPEYMPCLTRMGAAETVSMVYRPNDAQYIQTGISANGNSVCFSKDIGDGGNVSVTINNIQVTTDIDFGIFSGLKKADATVSFDDEIVASYTSEHYSKTIPLGNVILQLGSTPCNVELSLVLNIGFDGSASLTYTSHMVGKVGYKSGCGLSKSLNNENATFDFHAEATVTAEPTAKVDLRLFDRSIVNLKVTSGVVAIANLDVDLMGNQPVCLDIYLYVPLRWAVNEDGCIMTNISNKLKYSATVWDSTNSKITKRYHWEDGILVDECTRREEEKIETPEVAEDGQPYDEYKIFEFEEIDFEVIRLSSSKLYLEAGQSISIDFVSIPEGYLAGDLIYSVDDSSICNVSGGVVTGVSSGSTTVKVSTPDGKYNAYFTVTIKGDFNNMTDFQPL